MGNSRDRGAQGDTTQELKDERNGAAVKELIQRETKETKHRINLGDASYSNTETRQVS